MASIRNAADAVGSQATSPPTAKPAAASGSGSAGMSVTTCKATSLSPCPSVMNGG